MKSHDWLANGREVAWEENGVESKCHGKGKYFRASQSRAYHKRTLTGVKDPLLCLLQMVLSFMIG